MRDSLARGSCSVPRLRREPGTTLAPVVRAARSPTSPRCGCADGATVVGRLPAAGMPWFMTVFGRDTLITCLQTLLFGPGARDRARSRRSRSCRRREDDAVDRRRARARSCTSCAAARRRETGSARYYGTVDATPLFLVLLSEVVALDRRRRARAAAARARARGARLDRRYGDRDGDGFVEYERRTTRGLENQSWKDSGDSQRFHDGSFAQTPIAPAEVQGYVYDAKLRLAELAREVWDDAPLADRLEAEAARAADALRRGVLGRRARRLLRARARRRRSGRSTRSARTSAICSGAGSSRASASSAVATG